MLFRQLQDKESSTFTYILADEETREAIIIDSVKENLERDLKLIEELKLKLLYSIETHIHADHITATKEISKKTGAKTVSPWTADTDCADIKIKDGDTLSFGKHQLTAIYTPGHTDTCMSYLVEGMIFTGDALFIRGTGRTDFQSGSAKALYKSITEKLYTLPAETLVYPGHDYNGMSVSTIAEEKEQNPRINDKTSEAEFIKTMSELNLPNPKKIHQAVPANLKCGQVEASPELIDKNKKLIDVRSHDEHKSGTIPGSICIPHTEIDSNLDKIPKDEEVILFCQSGNRSSKAKAALEKLGYQNIQEIEGGYSAWSKAGNPIKRERKAIPMQRQVMIAAGGLTLAGTALGHFVDYGFYALAAFVGAGLSFAGISGFCGMALLLEKMPWNSGESSGGTCSV